MIKIVYQGEPGCFSEKAILKYFGKHVITKGVKSFEDIIKLTLSDNDYYGILPVENSLIGKIPYNYDLLIKYPVKIIGEIKLRVSFGLLSLPDTDFGKIKEVWSHPAAIEQCKTYLFDKGYKIVSIYDTAGGAKLLKKENRKDVAILAGNSVAEEYGLQILDKEVENNKNNYTRFIIITSNKKKRYHKKGKMKTSIVFGVKDSPGILFKCLSVFAMRNINLCNIESRPIEGKPWEYIFFIDFEGDMGEERIRKTIEGLNEIVDFLKIFGSYPSMEDE